MTYTLNVNCGDCGSELEHVQSSLSLRTEARAICQCSNEDCGGFWLVDSPRGTFRPGRLQRPRQALTVVA